MNIVRALGVLGAVHLASCQWHDMTGKHQKWNIIFLAQGLTADTHRKFSQVIDLKKEHSRYLSFEVGYLIGQIREKYKLMMEFYRICYNRLHNKINFATPKIYAYTTVYYFIKQELVLLLAMEIDKLVEVLEKTNIDVEPFPSLLEGYLRTRHEASEEQKQRKLEEAVKSRYRQEYLLKKLNSPVQSTAKKRFLNNWPVPGTWSLEKY